MGLFIFFALPLATILLAIVLQKILRSPILVAITFFAIYLIIAFVSFSDTLAEALITVIILTLIAYITAYIVKIICRCERKFFCNRISDDLNRIDANRSCCNTENDDENSGNRENNLLRISCSCGNSDQSNDLLTVNSSCFANELNNNNLDVAEVSGNINERGGNIGATVYGNNISRNSMQRRCYRRW